MLHEGMRGGGDQSDPPSILSIQPIDMKRGMKLPVKYSQVTLNWFPW